MSLYLKITVGTFLLGLGLLPKASVAGVPSIPPLPRQGFVIDSATGKPLWGVRIEMRKPAYFPPGCALPKIATAVTDSLGAYAIALGCRVYLSYTKSGYVPRLLIWPSDLVESNCGSCREMHPVRLVRAKKEK
jgi:hypothetical protein